MNTDVKAVAGTGFQLSCSRHLEHRIDHSTALRYLVKSFKLKKQMSRYNDCDWALNIKLDLFETPHMLLGSATFLTDISHKGVGK